MKISEMYYRLIELLREHYRKNRKYYMLAGKEGNRTEQEVRLWMSSEMVKFADMVKKYEDLCIQLDYWDRGE